VKALATGDPRILEKARVDAELARLERLERAHARNQRTLAATIDKAEKPCRHSTVPENRSRTPSAAASTPAATGSP
jgi:hypothetical protein